MCTGGLGLAAIQIAKAAGAAVSATAGSVQKRTYLRQQGVQDVVSSRNLEFGEHLERSAAAQPTIVLNSLTSPGDLCMHTVRLKSVIGRIPPLYAPVNRHLKRLFAALLALPAKDSSRILRSRTEIHLIIKL